MAQPGRKYNAGNEYRYGFNGKELDADPIQYDYGFRIYDPRLGKFLSVDPLFKSYPWYTPYQFAGNMPISCIDLDGLEERSVLFLWQYLFAPKLKKSEWWENDRQFVWGSFSKAAKYNTENLNSSLYKPISQIHAYYVWATAEVDKKNSNIKFFEAAREVTGLFGVDGAYSFPSFSGLSNEGIKSLADVNSRLLKENMPVIRELLKNGASNVVNGKGIIWDFNYVHREQSFLAEVIQKEPLSKSDGKAINSTFKKFEVLHPEYTLAKNLIGDVDIDYNNQNHREAIGKSLVFIKHYLKERDYQKTSQSDGFKSAVDYLKSEYGEKNTNNFIKTFRETFGK